jgi:ATPase subunit of ABC transporter with duplicated ATPase domains
MLQKPNVLVLDEPTNHLDLESINALNIALQRFQGTVLLVTHDHDLIDEVATRIWHFDKGHVEDFKGPYADYLLHLEQNASIALREVSPSNRKSSGAEQVAAGSRRNQRR